MSRATSRRRSAALFAALAFVAGAVAYATMRPADAGHQPADKVSVTGSTVEVMNPEEEVVLLETSLRTSTPADLLLSVTAECSIITDVTTVGNDDERAEGKVTVWIEVDGGPDGGGYTVPIDRTAEPQDNGEVVFCNRSHQSITTLFDDEDATIQNIIETRAANGFNWVAENMGNGIHDIVVKARFERESTEGSEAHAGVVGRTLVIEPTHMPTH